MLASRGRGKIRAPRRGLYGATDNVDFDEAWAVLRSSLVEIHSKNASSLSFEELYRHAYKLVLKKQGDRLYNQVKDFEEVWLRDTVQPRIAASFNAALLLSSTCKDTSALDLSEIRVESEKMLEALRSAWQDHILCMNMITDVLMYMERVYCKDFRKPSIFSASMSLFRDCVLNKPLDGESSSIDLLLSIMLDQILRDRRGELIDKALLKTCVYMLEALHEGDDELEIEKLYLTRFEPDFLEASRDFYRTEGAALVQEADASLFCKYTHQRIEEEEDRCRSTLSPLSWPKLNRVLDTELVAAYLPEIIILENSGVVVMLDNDRYDDLRSIYSLSARIDEGKTSLKDAIQQRIQQLIREVNAVAKNLVENPPVEEGERPINQQTSAAVRWVDEVLVLKKKYDAVLERSWHSDIVLQTAINQSFALAINELDRSTEYLSLFFDENMKKGIKGKTDNEVDDLIEQGITILRYISDKDLFERYYKRHLSKRLLMKRSVSMDAEQQMIAKMKLTVGNSFTQRIEKMFQDIFTSAELSNDFHKISCETSKLDLDVNVLTSTMWPQEAMASKDRNFCVFPSEVEEIKQKFEKFYLARHSGRCLTWQANMGMADVRAFFPECKGSKKTRDLNVSTYVMIILLLFNDLPLDESISCEEIQARTNIPMADLTRHLQSVSVANKTRILRKEPKGREVELHDRFYFNSAFYSPFSRIKVNVPAMGNRVERQDERSETERKNDDERKGLVDAALVRIMKSRKQAPHVQLVQELIQQVSSRFSPEIPLIKKRIESLIEREFLERIDAEPPAYRYLA